MLNMTQFMDKLDYLQQVAITHGPPGLFIPIGTIIYATICLILIAILASVTSEYVHRFAVSTTGVMLIFLYMINLASVYELMSKEEPPAYYNLSENNKNYTKSDYYLILKYKDSVEKEYQQLASATPQQRSNAQIKSLKEKLLSNTIETYLEDITIDKPFEVIEKEKALIKKLDELKVE